MGQLWESEPLTTASRGGGGKFNCLSVWHVPGAKFSSLLPGSHLILPVALAGTLISGTTWRRSQAGGLLRDVYSWKTSTAYGLSLSRQARKPGCTRSWSACASRLMLSRPTEAGGSSRMPICSPAGRGSILTLVWPSCWTAVQRQRMTLS